MAVFALEKNQNWSAKMLFCEAVRIPMRTFWSSPKMSDYVFSKNIVWKKLDSLMLTYLLFLSLCGLVKSIGKINLLQSNELKAPDWLRSSTGCFRAKHQKWSMLRGGERFKPHFTLAQYFCLHSSETPHRRSLLNTRTIDRRFSEKNPK